MNTKIMSLGLITALLLSTTAASAQTTAQSERVPGVRPTFDEGRAYGPKVPGVHPVLGAQTSYPSRSPMRTAPQAAAQAYGSNSLLGILGLGAGLALLAGAAGGGSDDGDSGSGGGGGTSWLDQGPGTEPDPSYRGEILTLLKRSGFSETAFINLVNGETRASDALISSMRQDERYLRNPALVQANFANKLALGLTGSGVKVGVFDSGIVWANRNMQDRLRGEGYAGFTGADMNRNRHGTQVANVLAGYSEDTVSRGIAPGVELHDIMVVPHDTDDPVFRQNRHGGALDYIVDNRLDIVNMSLASSVSAGGDLRAKSVSHLGGLTDDFRRATRNGTIFVVAAGNDANIPTVNSYAGLGIDPDISRGQILTVYSLAENGQGLSIHSNTCGQTMYSCIGAVGERLPVVGYAGNESRFSGTSAAAPVVSGALALLKEQNPELSSAQLVELVLFTATDMGERGVDEVYGRGILNMDRASVPVGGLRVVTGQTIDSPVISNQELSVNVSQGMVSLASVLDDKVFTGLDAFDRAFPIAASDYVSVKKGSLDPLSVATLNLDFGANGSLTVAGEDGVYYRAQRGWGVGFAKPEVALPHDGLVMTRGYTPLAHLDRGVIVGVRAAGIDLNGHLSTSGEDAFALWGQKTSRLAETAQVSYGAGILKQENAVFDTDFGVGDSVTGWVSASGRWEFRQDWSLMTEVVGARARYEGAGLFESVSANAWSAQLAVRKDGVFGGSLTGSVGVPLTVRSGTARLDMSGAREASEGDPTQGIERNRIRESFRNGYPVDVGIAYAHPIGDTGHLSLSVVERNNPSGKDETFAGVSVNLKF